MSADEQIDSIISVLEELKEDLSVPRNVKEKIIVTLSALKEDTEISIKVNKALNELEDIADDPNLQSYTRTQIWNIVSILENLG